VAGVIILIIIYDRLSLFLAYISPVKLEHDENHVNIRILYLSEFCIKILLLYKRQKYLILIDMVALR
jgi:hypothetical protein